MNQPKQKPRLYRKTDDKQFYEVLRLAIDGAQTKGMSQGELATCLQPLLFPESLDLKPAEAARLLGLSVSTLETYRWRKTGPSYFHTESGMVRYPWSAVMEYRNHQRLQSMRKCSNPNPGEYVTANLTEGDTTTSEAA